MSSPQDAAYKEALSRIEKAAQTKADYLDLSGIKLSSLPPEIGQLVNLQKLNLRVNNLSNLPPEIGQLINLQKLGLSVNKLNSLPSEIGQLANLRELYLSENKLSSLPPEICQLVNLQKLGLSVNKLDSLPSEIGQLANLRELSLSKNELSNLFPEIVQLTNLQELDLSENKLSSLPSEIGQLANLRELSLSKNELSNLFPEIVQLTNLQELDLSKNKLSSLPLEIGQLVNLRELSLCKNELSSLPPEIGQLTNLFRLDLSENKLSSLLSEIGQLANLEGFYIADNELSSLPPEIGQLTKLNVFIINRNKLSSLPPELGQLANLNMLGLNQNPIEIPPPEIIENGINAIREYLKGITGHEKEVYEAKLIIIGQGGVGKSCICDRLIINEYDADKPSTEGIEIKGWELKTENIDLPQIKMNVWDFGGQSIYHATHQFFLTQRSVYLLVWDARQEDKYGQLDHWLYVIETLGGDSPIILVLNKCDERIHDINLRDLKTRFPQIKGFFKVSCKKPETKGINSFDELKKMIYQTAKELPQMGNKWPMSWFEIREALEKLEKNGQDQIDYTNYKNICRLQKLSDRQIGVLSQFLHDLGVILHFQNDPLLKHTVILKTKWGTDAVYKVIDTRVVRERGGILLFNELDGIWRTEDGYPPDKHLALLQLMSNFELAFRIEDEDTRNYLVPELLSKEPADFIWDYVDNLQFQYHYSFMPAGIIPRFIVRLHRNLERHNARHMCWHEGALLTKNGARAYVRAIPGERRIEIRVNGETNRKREFLAIIRHELDSINSRFCKIKIDKKVPCQCSSNCSNLFDYERLCKMEDLGKEVEFCEISEKDIQIRKLLEGIERSYISRENMMKILMEIKDEVTTKEDFVEKANKIIKTKPIDWGLVEFDWQELLSQIWKKIKKENNAV